MFSCCGADELEGNVHVEQTLDLDESTETLSALLRLLHEPPPPPVLLTVAKDVEKFETQIRVQKYDASTVVPFPLLPLLFTLADKYALDDSIASSLRAHLLANAPINPLLVYGFATLHGLDDIADQTSKYLIHPPLWSYTLDEIRVVPDVQAYHKLVLLHEFRIRRLREIALAEEVFPHGYGECATHKQTTTAVWQRTQKSVALKIEAGVCVCIVQYRTHDVPIWTRN